MLKDIIESQKKTLFIKNYISMSEMESVEVKEDDTKSLPESEKDIESCTEDVSKSEIESSQVLIERQLPRNNCPEKIVLVLDVTKEDDVTNFQLSEGTQYSPFEMSKRALGLLVLNKLLINPKHEFALIILNESPHWAVDFTSKATGILNKLKGIEESSSTPLCDLSQLFNLLSEKMILPGITDNMGILPPAFIYRTIFMYGRSHCLPQFLEGKETFDRLINNPYFFLDILYAHESPSDDNKCEGIYDLLCDLDVVGWSYIHEVSRNATKYHNLCSTLLAHPLQRPLQKECQYTFTI